MVSNLKAMTTLPERWATWMLLIATCARVIGEEKIVTANVTYRNMADLSPFRLFEVLIMAVLDYFLPPLPPLDTVDVPGRDEEADDPLPDEPEEMVMVAPARM